MLTPTQGGRRQRSSPRSTHEKLREFILRADVVGADETGWRVMGTNGKPSSGKKWWAWSMTAPGAVWHGIAPSRSADAARQYLGEFDGTLMVDGYGVYDTLEKENDALLLAHCWAHARRKFVEAEPNYPQCTEALTLIGELFAIDRTTANPSELEGDAKLQASEARLAARQERAPPILEKLRAWALEQRGLPKSGLRKAIDYMLRYWPGLTVFVDDPYVPLDNNATERALRGCHAGMMRYRDRTRAYLDVRPRCPRAAEGNASLRRRRDVALKPAQDPNRPALTTAVCGVRRKPTGRLGSCSSPRTRTIDIPLRGLPLS